MTCKGVCLVRQLNQTVDGAKLRRGSGVYGALKDVPGLDALWYI